MIREVPAPRSTGCRAIINQSDHRCCSACNRDTSHSASLSRLSHSINTWLSVDTYRDDISATMPAQDAMAHIVVVGSEDLMQAGRERVQRGRLLLMLKLHRGKLRHIRRQI